MKQSLAPIISNQEVMPGVYLVWLESPEIAAAARPGQFVMVRCGKGDELLLRRPFSIHRVNKTKTELALLFQVVGKGTRWLSQCKVGASLDLFGPLGNGYSIDTSSSNLLLVAGGIGIAPLCFFAQEAMNQGNSVKLLIGAASASHLCPERLLPAPGECVSATEDGTAGKKGMITDFISDFADRADQVFACGPTAMYQTMATLPELKNKPVQISLEIMMGCGLGVCYGCTVKTKSGLRQTCKDGPVFDSGDILWDELDC